MNENKMGMESNVHMAKMLLYSTYIYVVWVLCVCVSAHMFACLDALAYLMEKAGRRRCLLLD